MPLNRDDEWTGLEYFYCDSVDECKKFDLQDDDVNDSTSPLMKTLDQVNFSDTSVISMLWSDQPKHKVHHSNHAHSKGIMSASLVGTKNAFIISHSTPRFPKLDDNGKVDTNVENNFPRNGQHFLCFSTTTDAINDDLADMYYQAEILIDQVSSTPKKNTFLGTDKYTALQNLWYSKLPGKGETRHRYSQDADHSHTVFTTRGNQKFKVFAQNPKYGQDIYSELIVGELMQNLIMETWVRRPKAAGLEKPVCDTYESSSNEKVSYSGKTAGGDTITFEYSYTKDHSKYGITQPKEVASASKGGSFIATDYSHPSLNGQILVSGKHLRKKSLEEEDIQLGQGGGGGGETSSGMEVDTKPTTTKRKAGDDDDDDEDSAPPAKRKAAEKEDKYVCVSDLNRQESQWHRGGLVYCFYNEHLWKHIDTAFIGKDRC